MTIEQRAALGESGRWVEQASRLLANLGFTLVESERGAADGGHLLVAIRTAPTLQHFDPEQVTYWVTEGGRGRPASIDSELRGPIDGAYAWGKIRLNDRLSVSNQFVSFGGQLRAQRVADGSILVDFSSSAPILRWSGHSQGLDPLTDEVGAFFARMKVPIDFAPGAEDLVSHAPPRTLYAAFVQDVRERLGHARLLRDSNRSLAEWSSRESQRLEAVAGEHWKAGIELRRQLGLFEAVARE